MNLLREFFRLFGYDFRPLRRSHATVDRHLLIVLRELKANCVVDVGANRGQFARGIRKHGYTGRIESFEPAASTYRELEAIASSDQDWRVHQCALGARQEKRTLNVTRSSDLASLHALKSKAEEQFAPGLTDVVARQEVEVRTLDAVGPGLVAGMEDPRVFLKMDTQGHDHEVFLGATSFLDHVVGIMAELAPIPVYEDVGDYLETLRLFMDAGFFLSGIYPVARERRGMRLVEVDCVMVRE